jgi:hypothetical protein
MQIQWVSIYVIELQKLVMKLDGLYAQINLINASLMGKVFLV